MKAKLAIAAVAALLIAVGLFFWLRARSAKLERVAVTDDQVGEFLKAAKATPKDTVAPAVKVDVTKPSAHGAGVDRSMAQLVAMMKAPEGATPCETAWLAVQAEQESAKKLGKRSIYAKVAERGEFMRICGTLPKDAQACMAPRYMAANRDKCMVFKPPTDTLKSMLEVRPELVDPLDEQELDKSAPTP
jgi:hypothetical protein